VQCINELYNLIREKYDINNPYLNEINSVHKKKNFKSKIDWPKSEDQVALLRVTVECLELGLGIGISTSATPFYRATRTHARTQEKESVV